MKFRNVIEPYSQVTGHRCPCCQFRTLSARGAYEICPVCLWEDDGQDDHDAELVRGGPTDRCHSWKLALTSPHAALVTLSIARMFVRPPKLNTDASKPPKSDPRLLYGEHEGVLRALQQSLIEGF